MSKPKWTKDQKKVIELRDRNILVAAAAGSGKTAVLVERIIEMVSDPEHPVDIDRLLVVTFTRAAAGEMAGRVEEALQKKLDEDPSREDLARQLSLLHNAQITTIDSFCQHVIRNYYAQIDLDPVYRVLDENESVLLKDEVLGQLLEEWYEKQDDAFEECVELFAPGRTDEKLPELILRIYEVAQSYPWPQEWLENMAAQYRVATVEELEQSECVQHLMEYLRLMTVQWKHMVMQALAICQEPDGPQQYLEALQSDLEYVESLEGAKTYCEFSERIRRVSKATLSRKRGGDAESRDRVKALREQYFDKGMARTREEFFAQEPEYYIEDMQYMRPALEVLVALTKEFSERFAQRKRLDGVLDFSDMEHFALDILVQRDEQGHETVTETARELQEYYQEIMIDEYQDSNYLQEKILSSISRGPDREPYLFMVGDVKQSIYQFRLARPDLFVDKYNTYTSEESGLQKIDLHQNFRSRGIVLDGANHIFYQVMHQGLGGVEYDEAASLVAGASFEECEEGEVSISNELLLLDQTTIAEGMTKVCAEATMVGSRIREMMDAGSPLYIQDHEEYRPVQYRDIVILLRSPSAEVDEYLQVLGQMGIPAYSQTSSGYFDSLEVATVLDLLRVIDNPKQDIPMAAVLRSRFGGLTDEELAWLATLPRITNYADALESEDLANLSTELQEKVRRIRKMLGKYREQAQRESVYDVLQSIYYETGYLDEMSAMPAGEKRRANLEMLSEQAVNFAQRGHRGLFAFVRYMERIRKADKDYGEALTVKENTDAVRIMSIHKSKGLEFPVVFVSHIHKPFNLMDTREATVVDPDWGVGAKCVIPEKNLRKETLLRRIMANHLTMGTKGEELRVLYVALTRAREKLILTGVWKPKEEAVMVRPGSGYQESAEASQAGSYLDWVLPAVQSTVGQQYFETRFLTMEQLWTQEGRVLAGQIEDRAALENWDMDVVHDEAMREALQIRREYEYPYQAEAGLPAKLSVSELKRRELQMMQAPEEETPVSERRLIEEHDTPAASAPSDPKTLTGAQRGTLYHLVMEKMPYETLKKEGMTAREACEAVDEEWILDVARRMRQQGLIDDVELAAIRPKVFCQFFRTELGQQMCEAAWDGRLHREQQFMIGVNASQVEAVDSEEMVLVQGIIDAFFTEGEDIVLVDYKTDRTEKPDGSDLVEKYRPQLAWYAQAIERLTQKNVSRRMIYSFGLGRALECQKEE